MSQRRSSSSQTRSKDSVPPSLMANYRQSRGTLGQVAMKPGIRSSGVPQLWECTMFVAASAPLQSRFLLKTTMLTSICAVRASKAASRASRMAAGGGPQQREYKVKLLQLHLRMSQQSA